MSETLEQVIADARGDAQVMRRNGQLDVAAALEALAARVATAAEEYLTWLPEAEAALFSGHAVQWLRAQYPRLERRGHAEQRGGRRYYRQLALPQRARSAQAFERGRQLARESA